MGGNGSFASGINKPYNKYEEVGYIAGVKVLKGLDGHHKLPEESRTSRMYIRVINGNIFKELHVYHKNHKLAFEIEYHAEVNLTGNRTKNVLHYHTYKNGTRSPAKILTEKQYNKYKKYFGGIKYD